MPSSSFPSHLRLQGRLALADLCAALRFFTRLPIPRLGFEPPWSAEAFGGMLRFAPVAGLLVGAVASLALDLGLTLLGLPRFVAVTLAIATEVLVAGGLHEDGLADVADGFGGGTTKARKLEIMRDSRLGTFGVLALVLVSLLRVALLTALLDRYGLRVAAAGLMAAAAASRGACLIPLAMLPPARAEGLAQAVGALRPGTLAAGLSLATFLGMTLAFVGGLSEGRAMAACAAALGAAIGVTLLSRHHIAGQTGDVAGAAQQAATVAFLTALLAAPWLG